MVTMAASLPTQPNTVARTGSVSSAAKDPLRPRRKKARRACHACQRAHLTCGDERPCQRCIKRGLQDHCQDGVRKKAKYLHDAPLVTPVSEYPPSTLRTNFQPEQTLPGLDPALVPTSTYFPEEMVDPNMGQVSPEAFQQSDNENNYTLSNISQANFPNIQVFDASDPSLFNFDISAMNFGSHYGALEFGMLAQMTGTHSTPTESSNASTTLANTGYSPSSYPVYGNMMDSGVVMEMWPTSEAANPNISMTASSPGMSMNALSHAYSVTNGPSSITSPSPPAPSPAQLHGFYESSLNANLSSPSTHQPHFFSPKIMSEKPTHPHLKHKTSSIREPAIQKPSNKVRPKDPSTLYASVTKPYAYTYAFHRLLTYLKAKFPQPHLNKIARAMAFYRPSFIACTKTLKEDDLVFMERCFQRTLWEYEKFIGQCGTPTIVWRRTGEVAAVGKEFTNLTGWTKEVLLGISPNLHKERHEMDAAQQAEWKTRSAHIEHDGPEPVFLAELLDQESVVDFYEQFAKIAFEDSRGAVMTKCKLNKYLPEGGDGNKKRKMGPGNTFNPQVARNGIVGAETGMDHLAKDGKIECTFCWTVKRDVFDIPMLIVGNVSITSTFSV